TGSDYEWEFGFQGQFRDEETGWLNYGYRFYVPELGRWINRDPIEEIGGTNMYQTSRNGPVNTTDALGLAPGDEFDTVDAAAVDALQYLISTEPQSNKFEYSSTVYTKENGKCSYTPARTDFNPKWVRPAEPPEGTKKAGTVHNHPSRNGGIPWNFSDKPGDKENADQRGCPSYIIYNYNGLRIKKYSPDPNKECKGEESIYKPSKKEFVPLIDAIKEAGDKWGYPNNGFSLP
ncbi:MAG: hypothetical protein KDM63_14535, partial [Verrucomicrobiae bacterium]|nr:hypothetical protein [Verrucomicrobiae bacterium]